MNGCDNMILTTAGEICSYIDNDLTNFVHTIVLLIKIAVPILLIIFGMLDFAKGVIGSNDDEIKKGQKIFIKRVISAAIVFFIISITQLVINLAAGEDSEIWSCASAIMNGTNTQVRQSNGNNSAQDTKKQQCCASAGGKVNSIGNCESWYDLNSDGSINYNSKHNVDTDKYNSCISTNSSQSAKKEQCCASAGGKVNSLGNCESWYDLNSDGSINYNSKHNVDTDKYNSCISD